MSVQDGPEYAITYSYQTSVYFEDNNDQNFGQNSQQAYGLINVYAEWRNHDKSQTLRLTVNNALDKEYIIDAGNTGNKVGLDTYVPGHPRSARLSFTFTH